MFLVTASLLDPSLPAVQLPRGRRAWTSPTWATVARTARTHRTSACLCSPGSVSQLRRQWPTELPKEARPSSSTPQAWDYSQLHRHPSLPPTLSLSCHEPPNASPLLSEAGVAEVRLPFSSEQTVSTPAVLKHLFFGTKCSKNIIKRTDAICRAGMAERWF